ncbi:hypothetical protein ElyMa_004968000 [Elysia marginata]|uniref:F-box domain-containing protein n=1 Tax=Elysia marginata TaxID=1093978 RepID=A0AAV4J296_9GAST|nr:hypothetical protein ElyMa_004968000 [Elysia marginata]
MQSTSASSLPTLATIGSPTTTESDSGSDSLSVADKYRSYLKYRLSSEYCPDKPIFAPLQGGGQSNLPDVFPIQNIWLQISKSLSARDIISLSGTSRGLYNLLRPSSLFASKLDVACDLSLLPGLCQAFDKLLSSKFFVEVMGGGIEERDKSDFFDVFRNHAALVLRRLQGYEDSLPKAIDPDYIYYTSEETSFCEWLCIIFNTQTEIWSVKMLELGINKQAVLNGIKCIENLMEGGGFYVVDMIDRLATDEFKELRRGGFLTYFASLIILDMRDPGRVVIRAHAELPV